MLFNFRLGNAVKEGALFAFLVGTLIANVSFAQTPAAPPTPTTKILAIGTRTALFTPQARRTVMPKEVRDTLKLYLAGKIEQWYSKQDQSGVVFVLNVTSPQEAHALLEQLPLGQAKMMEFELIPLGPLYPLHLLEGDTP